MCHTDARCSKSVSIPAPVHYAHLAAGGARAYKFGNRDSPTEDEYLIIDQHRCMKSCCFHLIFSDQEFDDDDEMRDKQMSLDDIKSKVMILHENIQNSLYFV